MTPPDAGTWLLPIARASIAQRLGVPHDEPDASPAWLGEPGASFVTLTEAGALRGCIGSLQAHRPLVDDVRSNAVAAAVRDPRFLPLVASELDAVRVEVSVLTEPVPLAFTDREDALAKLRPGIDGVVLTLGGRRATFLPQVWDELPDPDVFLGHLARKAGLSPSLLRGTWPANLRLATYQVTRWDEEP